jgi:hypothetical protein
LAEARSSLCCAILAVLFLSLSFSVWYDIIIS